MSTATHRSAATGLVVLLVLGVLLVAAHLRPALINVGPVLTAHWSAPAPVGTPPPRTGCTWTCGSGWG